ncbi:MAG: hypothetical protein GY756_25550, partial [bacterium]|nr:hypothetical protein [bacterium]
CYGSHSTQKTALAINILKEALNEELNIQFVLSSTLIDTLRRNSSFKPDSADLEFIRGLKKKDVIVIDDCFDPDKSIMWKNSDNKNLIISEWDSFFREVISSRTKIIVTSNFSMDVIKQHYGTSLHELIDRNFYPIHFTDSVKEKRKSMVHDLFNDLDNVL